MEKYLVCDRDKSCDEVPRHVADVGERKHATNSLANATIERDYMVKGDQRLLLPRSGACGANMLRYT